MRPGTLRSASVAGPEVRRRTQRAAFLRGQRVLVVVAVVLALLLLVLLVIVIVLVLVLLVVLVLDLVQQGSGHGPQ